MKLVLLVLLSSLVVTSAAITEKYVSVAGGGNHDGSDESNAFTWAEMVADIVADGKAGNRYNVKLGYYDRSTTADAISKGGTMTSPVIIRGYNSTIGDGYTGRTNTNLGLITNNFPRIRYSSGALNITGNFIVFECLSITAANNAVAFSVASSDATVHWCSVINDATGTGGIPIYSTALGTLFLDCDVTLRNGGGAGTYALGGYSFRAVGCYITSSNIGVQVYDQNATTLFNSCIIHHCATAVTNKAVNGHLTLANSTIADCTSGIGIVGSATGASTVIINCMITDITGTGIIVGSASHLISAYNRFRNNGTDISGAADWISGSNWGAVTSGSSSDYVDAAAYNYNLATGSPGRGVGIPSYRDMGALQSTNSASGGTGGSFIFAQ